MDPGVAIIAALIAVSDGATNTVRLDAVLSANAVALVIAWPCTPALAVRAASDCARAAALANHRPFTLFADARTCAST